MPFTPATFAPLRTERLTLRSLVPDDVDAVHAYQSDPEVCRYQLFEPRSREVVARRLEEFSTQGRIAQDGDDLELAIDVDGVGVVGHIYFKLVSVSDQCAEIGWALHRDHQGRGYATEAATAMLDYAFGELGLHRVRAELDARNEPSAALCRRLGMRHEAHMLEEMWSKGEWTDSDIYAILDREWAQRRASGA